MFGKYQHKSALVKTFQWLGLMAACGFALVIVYLCIPHSESIGALKVIQVLQSVGVLLIPAIIVACWWSEHPWQWLHINKAPSWQSIAFVTLVMVVALPGLNLISWINQQMVLPESLAPLEAMMKAMEERAADITKQFMQMDGIANLIEMILIMALLAAVSEEFTFRGVLQALLTQADGDNKNEVSHSRKATAIWVTAIIFSAIHFQFYGFLPRMLMGALFGYVLIWSGNLWLAIWMHFVNNAAVVIFYYYALHTGKDIEVIDAIGTGETLWLGIVSLVATALLIALLRKQRIRNIYLNAR